ncbi:MAG: hypothetical protein U5O69_01005 [Candidatus Competibacteraceae bacterium]|nr:hypothetical protein [Candidatus Competibacteraceae bacterium]
MTEKIISDPLLFSEFYLPNNWRKDDQAIFVEYFWGQDLFFFFFFFFFFFRALLKKNDPADFPGAFLGAMSPRQRQMTRRLLKALGLSRSRSIFKALQPTSKVRFETVMRVCRAMGLRLTTQTEVDPMVKTKGAGCRVGTAPR